MIETQMEYFSERQTFSPKIQAFVLLSTAVAGIGAYVATRDMPGGSAGFLVVLGAMIFTLVLFATLALTTTITDRGVAVKGLIFVDRLIRFEEIESAAMREYKPLIEYGGWGYRIGPSGKAYNAQGNEGVQLVLKNGKRVLIGSQRALELAMLISQRIGRS